VFNDARVVIGPSGAALFNAMFCRPGATLIEIPPHSSLACHYYYSIAAASGLAYWYVPGSVPADAGPGGKLDHADFHADIDAIEQTLASVLRQPVRAS
jgi:hypothetical protein